MSPQSASFHGPVDNLADLVRRAADARPDHPALVFADEVMTWRELDSQVERAAGVLQAAGLTAGDRVGLLLGNVPDFAVAYFGALRAGYVAVPVNTTYTAPEIGHLLADSGARAVVCGPGLLDSVRGLRADLPSLSQIWVTGPLPGVQAGEVAWDGALGAGAPAARPATGGGEDLAALVYTSGTSGRPRGAMLSHRALLANLEQCSAIDPPVVSDDDVVLLVLPLFHIYGLNAGLGMVARHGATAVLVERFDPVETLGEIARHGVTTILGAPPIFVAWSMLPEAGESFSSVRLALSGAAPLPAGVLGRVLEATGHHVFEGYGLTETAPVLASTLLSEVAKPDSIGRPVPGVELRLLDDSGEQTDEEDPGEIVVRGPNLFSGYWPDGQGGPDAAGWFATGDVAYADADGDLHLVDRRRDLVLVSGFNVYPREVEDVLVGHPDIDEAAVIGIPHPYTGASVKALVVLRAGARLSVEEVIAWCAVSLARFKCPTAVEFVAELPHSATGKVSKGRLRETLGAVAERLG